MRKVGSPLAKTLYLMRHGQTVFNVRRLIQGWCDSPLTERGIAQAKLTRDHIEELGLTFDHAYSSSAERAMDTVDIVTRGRLRCERTKGLKEFHYGLLEASSYDLVLPGTYESYGDFLVPFGGDSEDAVRARMTATLTEIMERPGNERVLAVSHGACIRAFTSHWDAHNVVHINSVARNCSLYTFSYEEGVFSLVDLFEPDDSVLDS